MFGLLCYYVFFYKGYTISPLLIERTEQNYGKEIEQHAKAMKLPAAYFKALVVLESSGKKPAESRFEPETYAKLLAVKQGIEPKFYIFTPSSIKKYSDNTLKQFATSWGPLQIMGYHAVWLNIELDKLKGSESLYYGMIWADKNYGNLLRKKQFKDAFHYHNTGKLHPNSLIPQTHDKKYIAKGLDYLRAFAKE